MRANKMPGALLATKTQNEVKTHVMKIKLMAASLVAATFSALVANACPITVAVDCGGNLLNGVTVNLFDCAGNYVATGVTGQGGVSGFITIPMGIPACAPCGSGNCFPYNVTVCVDPTTLPPGVTLKNNQVCQTLSVPSDEGTGTTFEAQGCTTPPVLLCWETGGGTIAWDGLGEKPIQWTFGGNIYPGCSPTAGGGGNLNIVNHNTGAHFTGENFTVINCRGDSTGSPKVTLDIIDWTGTGEVFGVAGVPNGTAVTFMGTFHDNHESGKGIDGLYITVMPLGSTVPIADFAIGTGSFPPAENQLFLLSSGNVQIHQSSCGH